MENTKNQEQIFCIFNQTKEIPSKQIGRTFEIYLRELTKMKSSVEKYSKKK